MTTWANNYVFIEANEYIEKIDTPHIHFDIATSKDYDISKGGRW